MSYSFFNTNKTVNRNLVGKILQQGQELRNAMVGSILRNDPFVIDERYKEQFISDQTILDCANMEISSLEGRRVEAFIKGDSMTKEEENLALNILRSLSAPDLCKTTERSIGSNNYKCDCYTCKMYNSNYFAWDRKPDYLRSKEYSHNNVARDIIQDKYRAEIMNYFRYVDSLKISISSFVITETGYRKLVSNDGDRMSHINQNFFLEYHLPDALLPRKNKSKHISASDNFVRLCAKNLNDVIHFKHVEVHDITSLDFIDLDNVVMEFKISYRSSKSKSSCLLGIAKFNYGSFLISKNMTCSRALPVFLNNNVPITVGILKVSLQLGCARLYFGQEFLDGISSSAHKNVIALDSDDSTNQLANQKDSTTVPISKSEGSTDIPLNGNLSQFRKRPKNVDHVQINTLNKRTGFDRCKLSADLDNTKENFSDGTGNFDKGNVKPEQTKDLSEEPDILLGFLYISEAQYLSKPISTRCSCKPFCQSDTSTSKIVVNSSNPVFNYSQIIPLIFNCELLFQLRENSTIVEFWKKESNKESLFGIATIPLHQFYLAYRNSTLIKYLSKNKLPVIGTDWWEPIYTLEEEDLIGQVQVLTAVGTHAQISNLKTDRGFSENIVKVKQTVVRNSQRGEKLLGVNDKLTSPRKVTTVNQATNTLEETKTEKPSTIRLILCERSTNTTLDNIIDNKLDYKSDVAIQANLTMEDKNRLEEKPEPASQDMLQSFLNQLLSQRQNVHVENSTNTELLHGNTGNADVQQAQNHTNVEMKKTTDLLDSLQTALTLDSKPKTTSLFNKQDTFRTSVAIISANHLHCRKKSKSRKSRNKSVKAENILPSCYVTFETLSEKDLKITPVVTKSVCPTWNYKCEVSLPSDLLTNSQKRLIFKVWRKSVNTVSTPNMQTDIVLGFAAVDLTVLLAGFPNIQGWFNVIDLSGQCSGQINVHVIPLDNLSKYQNCNALSNQNGHPASTSNINQSKIEDHSEPSQLLSRALKRKFVELDEITQRLRLRLSKVTNEDSDASSDGATDQFEKDINTLCIEEDFDLANFGGPLTLDTSDDRADRNLEPASNLLMTRGEEGQADQLEIQIEESRTASSSSSNFETLSSTSSKTSLHNATDRKRDLTLDQHFLEGKQKINTLLEKLSLLSAEACSPFTSRYVSGCSVDESNSNTNINTEAILSELDHSSRPNIQSSLGFNPLQFQQLYGDSVFSDDGKKVDSKLTPKE